MQIEFVTFTGADDNTNPQDMFQLEKDYPGIGVEWGLLLSKNNSGRPRYPSLGWLKSFCEKAPRTSMIAGHIQGQWLRDLGHGQFQFIDQLGLIWDRCARIQLNFHSTLPEFDVKYLDRLNKLFIFQMDGINDNLFVSAILGEKRESIPMIGFKYQPLFDKSAGEGIVPRDWPRPMPTGLNGYAGGLGPDNVAEQLERIAQVVPSTGHIWIDMETKIRSYDDKFDLTKCRQVLDEVQQRRLVFS